ncbi:MAG TPA: ABC transporter transmembrane domain-containing protein, partial [Spirochaetales bacterium]|nr:ABC transporter transmembrane domain-containing protein [Spirochaetales bacterium]
MLKRFFPYYRPYKGIFALDLAAALALAGIDLAFPVATRTVIDSIVPEGNWRLLWLFVIALAALYLARAGLEWIVGYVGHKLGVNIQRDMRRDIFAHLQR